MKNNVESVNKLAITVPYKIEDSVNVDIFDVLHNKLMMGCAYLKISSGGYGGVDTYHDCSRGGACDRNTCAVLKDILCILNNNRSNYWKFTDESIQEWSRKQWEDILKAYCGIKNKDKKEK